MSQLSYCQSSTLRIYINFYLYLRLLSLKYLLNFWNTNYCNRNVKLLSWVLRSLNIKGLQIIDWPHMIKKDWIIRYRKKVLLLGSISALIFNFDFNLFSFHIDKILHWIFMCCLLMTLDIKMWLVRDLSLIQFRVKKCNQI